MNRKNIAASSYTGRLRWKIENEGFNTLKNGGYGLEHKWARKSYQALKNYFQFMQMGYLINQLLVKSTVFQEAFMKDKDHPTLQSLWKDLDAAMKWAKIKVARLAEISATRIQFRFITKQPPAKAGGFELRTGSPDTHRLNDASLLPSV